MNLRLDIGFHYRAVSVIVASLLLTPSVVCGEVLFSADFEDGDLSKWTLAVPKAEITEHVAHSGRKALHIPYDIPAGEPAHKDNNRFVQVDMGARGIEDFFVAGCFYLASTTTPVTARKLFYIWGDPIETPQWDVIVSASGGDHGVPLSLVVLSNNWPYSDLRIPKWDIATGKINYDQWHCIRLDVYLNNPNQRDGLIRLTLDGQVEYERDAIAIRADLKPLGLVRVGAQTDRSPDSIELKHEDRYWDDVEIGQLASRPNPPSSVRVSKR